MKTICKIAWAEFRLLFYSPIAWLLLICFIILTGYRVTGMMDYFDEMMRYEGWLYWGATKKLFVGYKGIWTYVQDFVYFYIPLLTMGIMSKEFGGHSIKLLYSSPISNAQIILGKYFALVLYALILMMVLFIYAILGICVLKDVEYGIIWTGFLGLFLLICTYLAVGLFVSSLTSYQVIAAIGTFIVLMLLSAVKNWGQHYDLVREITYWLSINGRADSFMNGMICTEDVIYFLVITIAFLFFAIIRLNGKRQKERWLLTLRKNAIVCAAVVFIAYFSSRPSLMFFWDTTNLKENTLLPVSQDVVSKMDGGMTITSYVNVLEPHYAQNYGYPGFIMKNIEYFQRYTRFKPEIKLKTVYYYAEPDEDLRRLDKTGEKTWAKVRNLCERTNLDSNFLKTEDEIVDLSEEGYTFIRQIERENGQKTWLRVYDRGFSRVPTEAEITVALKRMITTLPKIGFIVGHEERSINDKSINGYQLVANNKKFQYSLWNQGFEVEEVDLNRGIPKDIGILVLADPRKKFAEQEMQVLKKYIDEGKHMFITGEPRHREVQNPLFSELFGIELTPMLVQNDMRPHRKLSANTLACIPVQNWSEKMYRMNKMGNIIMPTVAGVEVVDNKLFSIFSIARTDTITPCWTELETIDFVDDTIVFNPSVGEVCKTFSTIVGLKRNVRGKEQKIVILGDADLFSNGEIRGSVGGRPENILLDVCYWMTDGEAPIDVRRGHSTDDRMYLYGSGYKIVRWMFHWGIPLVILLLAIVVWLRRRSR